MTMARNWILISGLIVLVIGSIARSESIDKDAECTFQKREANDFYTERMPTEFSGWYNCGISSDLNVFFVANLSDRSEKAMREFFSRFEAVIVHDRVSTKGPFIERSGLLRFETERTYALTHHYVRVTDRGSKGLELIIYSDLPENLRSSRGRVLRTLMGLPDPE